MSDETNDDSYSGKTSEELQKEFEEQEELEILEKRHIITDIIEKYPELLKPHPINDTLYGAEEVDETLVQSILDNGQLEPIIINKKNQIISGHRRWLALKYINENTKCYVRERDKNYYIKYDPKRHIKLKAKCSIADFKDDETNEQIAIINYNRHREKRASQLFNEIVLLKDIYSRDASIASISSKKEFRDDDVPMLARMLREADQEITDKIDSDLSDHELVEEYGYLLDQLGFDLQEYVIESMDKDYPRTRDEIAGILDIGHTNMEKLYEVGMHAKAGHEAGIFAMKKLDREKREERWTINGASIVIDIDKHSKTKERGHLIAESIIRDVLENGKSPSEAKKEFDKKVPKEKKVPTRAKIERPKPTQDTYSIIYLNPVLFHLDVNWEDKLKDLKLYNPPSANNSALFLRTYTFTLLDCIKLMELWNFEYKSYTVVDTNFDASDFYFPSAPYILLFGTKGNWSEPAQENLFTDVIIQTREKIYEVIEKMYPDVKSRYEPFVKEQREGWGISVQTLQRQERQKCDEEERKKRDNDRKKGSASPAAEGNWV